MRRAWRVAALMTLTVFLGGVSTGAGEEVSAASAPPGLEITPPRVSYVSGEVLFWRPGAGDWAAAPVNTPLAPGDWLHAGADGAVEAQIGPLAWIRAASGTELALERHERGLIRFEVRAGHVALHLREIWPGEVTVVSTPHGLLTVERPGDYRVSVGERSTTVIAHRGGGATLSPTGGRELPIGPGQQAVVSGDPLRVEIAAAPALSEWDAWNRTRTEALVAAGRPAYVSPALYGSEQLTRYGSWSEVEAYGWVWMPVGLAPGWMPYSTGRWIWDPRFGWTWLDDAPWGWIPFHHGRWVHVHARWAWAPGPVLVRPVWAPALVVFLGAPGVTHRPFSWVALGWGEPVIPWWGPPRFVGRPWWGGWGGPRVVNTVVVSRTTVVSARDVQVFSNTGVRDAVVAVRAERFGRDPVRLARVRPPETSAMVPLAAAPPAPPQATAAAPAPRPRRSPSAALAPSASAPTGAVRRPSPPPPPGQVQAPSAALAPSASAPTGAVRRPSPPPPPGQVQAPNAALAPSPPPVARHVPAPASPAVVTQPPIRHQPPGAVESARRPEPGGGPAAIAPRPPQQAQEPPRAQVTPPPQGAVPRATPPPPAHRLEGNEPSQRREPVEQGADGSRGEARRRGESRGWR